MALRIKTERLQQIRSLTDFGMGKSQIEKDKEEEERLKEQMPATSSSGYSRPSQDMAAEFIGGLEPHEMPMPEIPAIIVCPTCKVDVEECEKLSVGGDSAFCYCPKCLKQFFIFELMRKRSWRRKFGSQAKEAET